ncbi:hypothetical protein LTR24_004717 [Lithohypha guttulata]|uniref:RING-type domain-containing protein n=1 Tax=Lithohypha guttulata TaxID=1690604 RepID=A0ABR0KC31_9EURO|nr:hypothetical protein LTR24_004717 [Lithohypha guttulata]
MVREVIGYAAHLPRKARYRLSRHVQRDGLTVVVCSACKNMPDEPQLANCGHIYCEECSQGTPYCVAPGCRKWVLGRTTSFDLCFLDTIEAKCKKLGLEPAPRGCTGAPVPFTEHYQHQYIPTWTPRDDDSIADSDDGMDCTDSDSDQTTLCSRTEGPAPFTEHYQHRYISTWTPRDDDNMADSDDGMDFKDSDSDRSAMTKDQIRKVEMLNAWRKKREILLAKLTKNREAELGQLV